MIKALKGELYKNISVLGITAFIAVTIMFAIIAFGNNEKINNKNWKEYAKKNKVVYEQQIVSLQQNDNNREVIGQIKDEIMIMDYCLKNDCAYGITTVGLYMKKFICDNQSLIIAIIVMIGFGIIFMENSNKTWKTVLTTGVDSNKLLIAKLCSMAIIEGIYSIITIIIAYFAGLFKYGNNYKDYTVLINNGNISTESNIVVAFKEILIVFLFSIFLSMLMYLLYSLNMNKNVILVGIYIIIFLSYYLNKFLKIVHIDKFTPIKYLYQDEQHIFGMFIMVSLYSVVFMLFGNKFFKEERINK